MFYLPQVNVFRVNMVLGRKYQRKVINKTEQNKINVTITKTLSSFRYPHSCLIAIDTLAHHGNAANLFFPSGSWDQALKTLGWCRLSQRRTFHRCLFVRKALQGSIDFDFGFHPNSEFHKYNTRQKDNLHLPLIRKSWGRQRLIYTSIKDWNSLDKDLRNIQCEATFKSRLRAKVCNPWFPNILLVGRGILMYKF